MSILEIVLVVLAVESLTEIGKHSDLLAFVRRFLTGAESGPCGDYYPDGDGRGLRWFFRKIFACGWCLSVWVSFGVLLIFLAGLKVVLVPFAVQRVANYLHVLYESVRSKRESLDRQ